MTDEQIDALWDDIRNDENFFDYLWQKFDTAGKRQALELSGWDPELMVKEWVNTHDTNSDPDDQDPPL